VIKPFDPHQREELIEDLMALKDAIAEEEVGSSPEEDFV